MQRGRWSILSGIRNGNPMLRSMTTFARMEYTGNSWSCALELRSVNGRFCDVNIRLPKWMNPIEDHIKKLVQERMIRGRIDLSIQHEDSEATRSVFEPDLELGRSYLDAVRSLADGLSLEGTLDLPTLLCSLEDVIIVREQGPDAEKAWERIRGQLEELLDKASAMSATEGIALEKDLESRLSLVEQWIEDISRRKEEHLTKAQQALKDRIQSILRDLPADEGRLAHEMAILADKLDITEEIVRVRSHIEQFRKFFAKEGAIGRKMDFLLQELFREVNTMASKSSDSLISYLVVEIKGELEKMREQVQNIV
jgi:uncharacterized protein (TIGR00255 family)